MEKRIYITDTIRLRTKEDSQTKTFRIRRKLAEGASVICYEGYFKSGTIGTLREFYPRSMAEFLTRNEQGQLIFKENFAATKNLFRDKRDNYLRPYDMLRDMLHEKDREISKLETFIPPFEIYFGESADENSAETVYVWTPEPRLETFEKICDKIHKRPAQKSETKLFIILQAIRSLTKCICALHGAELIHRDIKPSNFGFKKFNGEILPQTISLFDIDTVCSVYDDVEVVFSEGYTAPEISVESADNLTDIYSIGATLFSAVIVSEDKGNDYTFRENDFDNLKYLVDNSELITASTINSQPRLREYLTTILQKTLCRRENRYQTCEKLLEDIDAACRYILPPELLNKNLNGEKWILKDVEKSFDKAKEKNVSQAIQYHLYEHPLYKTMSADEKNLHVLIFGFGNYGQKFLDICLQTAQMVDTNFSVTVVSDNSSDKEIYLSDRPALKNFFDIDNDTATCGQSYGKISFQVATIAKNENTANSDAMDNFISDICEKASPHYIFIALGNDALNKSAATACRTALNILEIKCLVNFAQEKNLPAKPPGIIPLYIRRNVKTLPIYSEIERMAFNAHLVWKKSLNVNFNDLKKEFLEPYNHDACVSNVLSIKYKLHSIGIDIKKLSDFVEAAKIFVEKNLHRDGKKNSPEYALRNKLIFVEHKRWVVEKICNGWRQMNLEDCRLDGRANAVTKNKKLKTHMCILPSRADRLLHDNFSAEDWDTMSPSELEKLDALDKMSVQLHQKFRAHVDEKKIRNSLRHVEEDIAAEISHCRATASAFSEFQVCLRDIMNGDYKKILLYENLKSVFENSLAELNSTAQENVKTLLKSLENIFQPILNAEEYVDYKQKDVDLIDNIPFMLTYSTKIAQIIPYNVGNNSEIFGNVAAATVINPAKIIYLALIENKTEVIQFKKSLVGLFKYLNRKNLRAEIEFAIAINADSSERLQLKNDIVNLGGKRIRLVKIFPLNAKNKIAPFKSYLKRKGKGNFMFLLEKNSTHISGLLEGGKICDDFNAYEFNSLNMKFNHCEFLNYIKKKNFITANDLTELNSSKGIVGEQPAFFGDYKALWKKYRESPAVWKTLCNLLDEHSRTADIIVRLNREPSDSVKEYTFLLPQECLRTVEDKILKVLKAKNIIKDFAINVGVANSFEVTIKDVYDNETRYKKLFANPYALFQPDAIKILFEQKTALVIFDNLIVKNFSLYPQDRRVVNLLNFFAEKNYLTKLNINDMSEISFTYATRTIKNLLTVAGKILEIYVWHEIKSSGYFDDVVSNFELNWNNSDVKNEIDCIAMKNFKVLIIECKARQNIEQDFHHKLSAISAHFGINCTPVLIADTQKVAEGQLERSVAMQIVTVWQENEIDNIAATLKKIIK